MKLDASFRGISTTRLLSVYSTFQMEINKRRKTTLPDAAAVPASSVRPPREFDPVNCIITFFRIAATKENPIEFADEDGFLAGPGRGEALSVAAKEFCETYMRMTKETFDCTSLSVLFYTFFVGFGEQFMVVDPPLPAEKFAEAAEAAKAAEFAEKFAEAAEAAKAAEFSEKFAEAAEAAKAAEFAEMSPKTRHTLNCWTFADFAEIVPKTRYPWNYRTSAGSTEVADRTKGTESWTDFNLKDGIHLVHRLMAVFSSFERFEDDPAPFNKLLRNFESSDEQLKRLAMNYVFSKAIETAVGQCCVLRLVYLFCDIAMKSGVLVTPTLEQAN